MNPNDRRIALKVEFPRLLELFSDQIYQSPLALIRENTQNAFDAVRMRQVASHEFVPAIDVTVTAKVVTVHDNGIGMTTEEVETHFWHAGKSGKNTDAARAAGVVGTFGIGALANFGVAVELSVESESAIEPQRTISSVRKAELSTEFKGISVKRLPPVGCPGTKVTAHLADGIRMPIQEVRTYLREFVEFLDIPVFLNGEQLSGRTPRDLLPSERRTWTETVDDYKVDGLLHGDLEVLGMASGELRLVLDNIEATAGYGRRGTIVLLQDRSAIRTLRSGFGLATIAIPSRYRWGGVLDLPFLTPTAGREALDLQSTQLLQILISALDRDISPIAASHPESFTNNGFLDWIVETRQFSLCNAMEVVLQPTGVLESLESAVGHGGLRYYSGRDQSVITTYAGEDEPLVMLPRRAPRRQCIKGYLDRSGVREVDTSPSVKDELPITEQSFAHSALAARVTRILEEDYFLPVDLRYGTITGQLPVLVTGSSGSRIVMFLDPESTSVSPLLVLYQEDYEAFGPFVKDFIRSAIFPRVSKLVPSSRRQGAEAFLRHLRANREWFEYEFHDKADLEDVLDELRSGRVTVAEVSRLLAGSNRSVVEVSSAGTVPLASVVEGLEDSPSEAGVVNLYAARPGIDRRKAETDALILTTESPVLNGYTCFLSLSDRVQREKGDFFLQPHSTQVIWGGRKVIFIFQHHSGQFNLYYDILCPNVVAEVAGGGPHVTSTILTKERTFIPIPSELVDVFLPAIGERKRLEVRCDIFYQRGGSSPRL